MRIAMLTYGHLQPVVGAPQIGGAARQCLKLSKALRQQGAEVTILTNRLTWREPIWQKIEGVPVVYLNTWFPLLARRGLKRFRAHAFILRALLYLFQHRHDYEIVHAHSAMTAGFTAVVAARHLQKRSIIKVMNSGSRNDILRFREDKTLPGARYMAEYLLRCDRVITLNPLAYDELRALGFRSDQLELIPNGVEVAEIEAKATYAPADPIRVIFVGRLEEAKGLDILLKAVKIFADHDSVPECQLLLLGKGALKPQLQALAASLGISDRVHFAGEVAEVPVYLRQSDIFALPSRAEGISNALLEAMACGLPCIASDIPGNRALIRHEQNGLLVQPDDETALAEAFQRLAGDAGLQEQLGRAARRTTEEQFDISQIARRYLRLYQQFYETAA
jgi:glycosyltransferase involved in cell wall biosynthesis